MNKMKIDKLNADVARLQWWVHDLQSGMYINCVYCGHRYGPEDKVQATMADALKEHIQNCPKHPMSQLREAWEGAISAARYVFAGEKTADPREVIDYIVAEKNYDLRMESTKPAAPSPEPLPICPNCGGLTAHWKDDCQNAPEDGGMDFEHPLIAEGSQELRAEEGILPDLSYDYHTPEEVRSIEAALDAEMDRVNRAPEDSIEEELEAVGNLVDEILALKSQYHVERDACKNCKVYRREGTIAPCDRHWSQDLWLREEGAKLLISRGWNPAVVDLQKDNAVLEAENARLLIDNQEMSIELTALRRVRERLVDGDSNSGGK